MLAIKRTWRQIKDIIDPTDYCDSFAPIPLFLSPQLCSGKAQDPGPKLSWIIPPHPSKTASSWLAVPYSQDELHRFEGI